ncbi:MAG: hypothetical protein PVJ27_00565, partial [Candidatus Brocadiaceae bacterium]
MNMFCYQCEQTAQGTGCTVRGVCGKDPEAAALQDLLVHAVKGVSMYAHRAAKLGAHDREVGRFVTEALFTTLTNVDFDAERLAGYARRAAGMRDRARGLYKEACAHTGETPEELAGPAAWEPADDLEGLVRQGEEVTIEERIEGLGDTVAGLQELIVYGIKGAAAYAYHAAVLDEEDDALYAAFHELLDYVAGNPTDVDDLLAHALKTGELNLEAMALLDAANTGAYGHPEP